MKPAVLAIALGAAVLSSTTVAADQVDDYVRAQVKARRIPGLSRAVVQHGQIVKAEGYGVASRERDVPATRETVYEIGSITKQFTANAILLLVEAGRIHLDISALRSTADTTASTGAARLVERLPPAARERVGTVLRMATAIDALGDERVGARHFIANPDVARLRRYRVQGSTGARHLTLQLTSNGELVGALIEE